jgi:hypothetical protein
MRQSKALADQASIVAPKSKFQTIRAGGHADERFFIEDGWVFREHHGKYVECICRSDEISTLTEAPNQTLSGRV